MPVTGVLEEKIKHATEVAEALGQQPGVIAAYIAGSLTAGLGNATSDADVFLVVDDDVDIPPAPPQYLVSSGRVDVERIRLTDLTAATEALLEISMKVGRLGEIWMESYELDTVIRFFYRRDVITSEPVERLGNRLAASETIVRRFLINYWARGVSLALEDFQGALLDDDYATAALNGQRIMICAGKAFIAGCGEYYVGEKWTCRQLERATDDRFPYQQFRYLQSGSWAIEDPPVGGESLIHLAQTMIIAAQLLGWDTASAAAWSSWDQLTPSPAGGLQRSPDVLTFRLDEGVLLNRELVRQHVVEPRIAAVWALCNGGTQADVEDGIGRVAGAAGDLAPNSAGVEPVIKALLRRELVQRIR